MKRNVLCQLDAEIDPQYIVIKISRTLVKPITHVVQIAVLAVLLWFLFVFLFYDMGHLPFFRTHSILVASSILYPILVTCISLLFLVFNKNNRIWWLVPVALSLLLLIQSYLEVRQEWGPFYYLLISQPSYTDIIKNVSVFRANATYAYAVRVSWFGTSILLSLFTSFWVVKIQTRRMLKRSVVETTK